MRLFESTYRKKWDYYERYFDTSLNKSVSRKIDLPCEWYVEDSRGDYSYILDDTVKLKRVQGKSKDGREEYGFIDPMYRNIKDNYWNKDRYNKTPRIFYLDIETRSGVVSKGFPVPDKALEEITLFQIFDSITQTMIVLGSRPWKHEHKYKFDYSVKYIQCKDEIDLIEKYLQIFKKLDPLIIYAWNADGFDYPYIYNRLKNLGFDTNRLSNYGETSLKTSVDNGKLVFDFKSDGHYYFDLLKVYKKFTFGDQASYSLDYTAELVLGERKVAHTEYIEFDDFYSGKYVIPQNPTDEQLNSDIYKEAINGNWDEVRELSYSEFVYYGIKDTHLIVGIDNAKNFTNLILMLSEKMGVPLSDAMGTVKAWSCYITNRSLLNKQVMPPRTSNDDEISIKGGFVREPVVGKHSWILSADVNSMYPLLGMVGFNMSPETFIPKHKLPSDLRDLVLKYYNDEDEDSKHNIPIEVKERVSSLLEKYNYSLGINGAVFDNTKLGMVPELVMDIYASRKKAKKTMFEYEKRKLLIKEILKNKGA